MLVRDNAGNVASQMLTVRNVAGDYDDPFHSVTDISGYTFGSEAYMTPSAAINTYTDYITLDAMEYNGLAIHVTGKPKAGSYLKETVSLMGAEYPFVWDDGNRITPFSANGTAVIDPSELAASSNHTSLTITAEIYADAPCTQKTDTRQYIMGEVIKICDFRIFVKALSLQELEEKCSEIFKNLEAEGYKTTTLLNEQKTEWQAFYQSSHTTHLQPFVMKGLTLTTEQLATGYPFHHSELIDEQGDLLGFTETGGAVIFDEFSKTKTRKHYNCIVCGDMGSGKSTLLKKRFKHNASIGNYIRTFDISGEFTKLTYEFGGKIIKCNGKDGMLNPLEILRSGEDDYTSYANHISKLQSFFKCIIPSMSDHLLQELANQLREFYAKYQLVPSDENIITGLEAAEYPTLSDLRQYLENFIRYISEKDAQSTTDVETALNVEKAKNLSIILSAVENLCNNFGNMFDGHTTINDITMEKIVTFDISAIKDLGNIFTAQMQNLVSLCWDNAVNNGVEAKSQWESGTVPVEDITKFLIIIDESHRWVNTSMSHILDMVIRYMREARKYFAGITLASQSVRDFMPQADAQGVDKIRLLFELSQYKFMFKQDSAAKEHIRNIFGDGMTFDQVEQIPSLLEGETIMSIAGDRSMKFKTWLSKDYEETLFAGGR